MSPHGTLSRSSAARMRNFVQATALRLVASIFQESLPGTSGPRVAHTPFKRAAARREQVHRAIGVFGKLALRRQCCAGCKLHEMLQVLARTASWHAREMAQFLDEIGSLARCLIFFGTYRRC